MDLNCDMGESWHDEIVGRDAEIMPYISSCNLACGVHGGDPETMQKSIQLALAHNVSIGAHPSLPGRENFGREAVDLSADELFLFVLTQVQTLLKAANKSGASLGHLKPHGALYNLATINEKEAQAVCRVCRVTAIEKLYGPPGSELERQAGAAGLRFVAEGFPDRAYADGLRLRPRRFAGAVIRASERVAQRALRFARRGEVMDWQGNVHPHKVQTLCIHGDHPEAVEHVKAIHKLFTEKGISIGKD